MVCADLTDAAQPAAGEEAVKAFGRVNKYSPARVVSRPPVPSVDHGHDAHARAVHQFKWRFNRALRLWSFLHRGLNHRDGDSGAAWQSPGAVITAPSSVSNALISGIALESRPASARQRYFPAWWS